MFHKTLATTGLTALLALCPPAIGAEVPPSGPFRDVPQGHWAYPAVQEVARLGYFTGYPDGTFSGRRALTRYEFAVALQRIVTEVQRKEMDPGGGRGPLLRRRLMEQMDPLPRAPLETVLKLVAEFKPELEMLGSDVGLLAPQVRRMADRNAEAVPAPKPEAMQSAAWKVGVQRARREWGAGKVVLYTYGFPGSQLLYDPLLGVPYEGIAGCILGEETKEVAAGHDEEIYRLVLQYGLPDNSQRPWNEWILNPQKVWKDRRRSGAVLDAEHREARSPDHRVFVRLLPGGAQEAPALEVRTGAEEFRRTIFDVNSGALRVELTWGPARSSLLFARFLTGPPHPAGPQYRHLVLDVRTHRVLNAPLENVVPSRLP